MNTLLNVSGLRLGLGLPLLLILANPSAELKAALVEQVGGGAVMAQPPHGKGLVNSVLHIRANLTAWLKLALHRCGIDQSVDEGITTETKLLAFRSAIKP